MNAICHQCGRSHDTQSMGYRAFVCSCGAHLETKQIARVNTIMPCPQCQALVQPGVAKCVHCNGALLTKPCHDCDQLAYVGHAACPHCHAEFARSTKPSATSARARECPRCKTLLTTTHVVDGTLDNCEACGGAYIEYSVLEALIGDVQRNVFDLAEALANAAQQHINAPTLATAAYVKCPDCRTIMNRRQFAHGAGVVLDGCKGHGTFFDSGEFRKVVEFMKSGGLVKAAEIEQRRRAANQLEAARDRERAQLKYASSPSRYTNFESNDVSDVEAVASLILSLFW